MDPELSKQLIKEAGGDRAFAEFLGIDSHPGVAQRVNNWKRRGIPAEVVLKNHDALRRLAKRAGLSLNG